MLSPIENLTSAIGVSWPVAKLILSTFAVSPSKFLTFSPNLNNPVFTWSTLLRSNALNPVALPSIISLSWNVPDSTNIVIVSPAVPTALASAPEITPVRVSPTLGKIPDALVTVNNLVEICWTVTSTYLTAATEFGGSVNTIESFKILNDSSGVCTTPLRIIINWFELAITLSPSIVSGNWVLWPSNKPDILSTLCTTEVKIFSEEVNLFCLNNTSVLLNSWYIGSPRAKLWIFGTTASLANSTDLVNSKSVSLLVISALSWISNCPNTLNDAGWTFLITVFFHSSIETEELTAYEKSW